MSNPRELPEADGLASEDLEALRRAHTPTEIPPCRVCGGELSIQACGDGEPTSWGCSEMEDDPERPGFLRRKAGRLCADNHYSQSIFEDRRHDDPRVLKVLDMLASRDAEIAALRNATARALDAEAAAGKPGLDREKLIEFLTRNRYGDFNVEHHIRMIEQGRFDIAAVARPSGGEA